MPLSSISIKSNILANNVKWWCQTEKERANRLENDYILYYVLKILLSAKSSWPSINSRRNCRLHTHSIKCIDGVYIISIKSLS